MTGFNLPYQPVRQGLYTRDELFQGFDPAVPGSWSATEDFAIYRHFVAQGSDAPANPYMRMMEALHDSFIAQSIDSVTSGRRVAAIMGGHKMARDSAAYRGVAVLARRLTRNGILICTGGGPGAMEASHLGAALSTAADSALDHAIAILKTQPVVPALAGIVDEAGKANMPLVAKAHAWFRPAWQIAAALTNPGESLAVPTWHYGHEPTTPLASHIAKYFQNSIREDGLLAMAKQGVIFSEGKAGTIQEIFQDGAQNYYRTFNVFSPMVFLGVEYWTNTYPVIPLLRKLFTAADFAGYVLITDDIHTAAAHIEAAP